MRSKWFALVLSALLPLGVAFAGSAVQNGPAHNGAEVHADLPMSIRVKNTVGTDGLGLCVWASAEMMARYVYCPELIGVFEYMQTQRGGGWPERVDEIMRTRAPHIKYEQDLGSDASFVKRVVRTGRPCCVTYGYGELYGGKTIAHMVLCVYGDDDYAAILDNNDPEHIWWMSWGEFERRYSHPNGQGWAWYIDVPPPPPVPHNDTPRDKPTPSPEFERVAK